MIKFFFYEISVFEKPLWLTYFVDDVKKIILCSSPNNKVLKVSVRRQKNIKDFLVRAKIPANTTRPHRNLKGMKKCTQKCTACPYIRERTEIKGCKFKWNISKNVNCETRNCVYMIECQKDYCNERYIGETERELR